MYAPFGFVGFDSVVGAVATWARRGFAAVAAIVAALALSPSTLQAQSQPPYNHPAKKAAAAIALAADGNVPDKVVKAGVRTAVATVWDCALPTMAPVVSVRAEHGTVAVRTGEGPSCGRPSMRLTEIVYTSAPGFRGTDTLHVLGFLTQGDIDQVYTVLVK